MPVHFLFSKTVSLPYNRQLRTHASSTSLPVRKEVSDLNLNQQVQILVIAAVSSTDMSPS